MAATLARSLHDVSQANNSAFRVLFASTSYLGNAKKLEIVDFFIMKIFVP